MAAMVSAQSSMLDARVAGVSFELGMRDESRELVDLLIARSPREIEFGTQVLRVLSAELDAIMAERSDDDGD